MIIILNNCYLPDEPQRAYIETNDGDEIQVDHLMTKEVKDLIFAKFNEQNFSDNTNFVI